jgi:hypothetical protein
MTMADTVLEKSGAKCMMSQLTGPVRRLQAIKAVAQSSANATGPQSVEGRFARSYLAASP